MILTAGQQGRVPWLRAHPPGPLDELLVRHPLPTRRELARPIMVLLALLLIWANFATLDQVAVAQGVVVPSGKVKVIQHLEGGIIEDIRVKDGSVVAPGDLLIRLNLATSGVNRPELLARLDALELQRARFLAESRETTLNLPADAAARQPNVADAERQTFATHRRELQTGEAAQRELIRQRKLEVQQLEAKREAAAGNLDLARQRLQMSASLLEEGLTARMDHLRLQAEVKGLEGELQGLAAALPRARAAVAEAEQRRKEASERARREAQDALSEAEQNAARVREMLAQAEDQSARAEVRSPIAGIVQHLRHNTIGGVVSPGEPIMEIVPTNDRLVIEARLNPSDRGSVHPGLPAKVKISAFDFVRYGALDGIVKSVAPDSAMDNRGNPYFTVIIETNRAYLGDDSSRLNISAGMEATAEIQTGRRTVAQYLIKPVLKLRDEAFREP